MAERVKRQRLKPEVRREKLLEAATEVFAERGYEGARVEQIADVAQVSPGLLYRHFEGKQELYEELLLLANRSCWSTSRRRPRRTCPPTSGCCAVSTRSSRSSRTTGTCGG